MYNLVLLTSTTFSLFSLVTLCVQIYMSLYVYRESRHRVREVGMDANELGEVTHTHIHAHAHAHAHTTTRHTRTVSGKREWMRTSSAR